MYDSFDSYIEYLDENKQKLPDSVYLFASDPSRHDIESPHSLHDSWMTSICIKENRNRNRPFNPKPSIEIELLGQMHDRNIYLNYESVESYSIVGEKNPSNWGDTFQGDIACHEVTLVDDGMVRHEIYFTSESKIIIICKSFECSEDVYA